jgi:hypothetical protein
MVVLLVSLAGIAALGGLTALSVRGSSSAASHHRFKASALYAAESGAAAAVDFLRRQTAAGVAWSTLVSPYNDAPSSPDGIVGNNRRPGDPDNPFGEDTASWYEVTILNNPTDVGFVAGEDTDFRLVLRAIGHGPDDAVATVEWEVRGNFATTATVNRCPGYGQRGLSEDNSGRNDCLATIDATDTATYAPGAP